jgi:hypothetical protein
MRFTIRSMVLGGTTLVLAVVRPGQAQGTTIFAPSQSGAVAGGSQNSGAAPGARVDALALAGIPLADAQRDSLRSLYAGDRDAVRQILDAHSGGMLDSAAHAQLVAIRQQYLQQIRSVLTPDQQKTYDRNVTRIGNAVQAAANPYGGNAPVPGPPGPTALPPAPAATGAPGPTPIPPAPATSGVTPGATPTPPTPVTPVAPAGPS